MVIKKTLSRRNHDDGSFSDYATFNISPSELNFVDIDQRNEIVKLQDIAHYRFVKAQEQGVTEPVIITFGLIYPDRHVTQVFPGYSYTADYDEQLLSANSWITHTLRTLFRRGWIKYDNGIWQTTIPITESAWQQRGRTVVEFLTLKNLLYIKTNAKKQLDFAKTKIIVEQDLLPVGRCGFISDFSHREHPQLVFNTAYFLLEQEDIFSYHSAICEGHSFWMHDGIIHRPPLFRRSAIWQKGNGLWEVGLLGLDDLRLILPDGKHLVHEKKIQAGKELPYTLNDDGPSDITIYTRYYGVSRQGQVLGFTPVDSNRFELTVIDRRVVSWKIGGGLPIPHNGFVISFAQFQSSDKQALLKAVQLRFLLKYEFVDEVHQSIRQGIQAGPLLLQNGQSPLKNGYLEDFEEFWPSRVMENGFWQMGVVSTNYDTNVDKNRAGRVGVGIDIHGNLVVAIVAGVNNGMAVPGVDSIGATLLELAEILHEAGCVSAINLDGGGSAQAYFMGGQAVVPGDRRGIPKCVYQRMIPAVGIVR